MAWKGKMANPNCLGNHTYVWDYHYRFNPARYYTEFDSLDLLKQSLHFKYMKNLLTRREVVMWFMLNTLWVRTLQI